MDIGLFGETGPEKELLALVSDNVCVLLSNMIQNFPFSG